MKVIILNQNFGLKLVVVCRLCYAKLFSLSTLWPTQVYTLRHGWVGGGAEARGVYAVAVYIVLVWRWCFIVYYCPFWPSSFTFALDFNSVEISSFFLTYLVFFLFGLLPHSIKLISKMIVCVLKKLGILTHSATVWQCVAIYINGLIEKVDDDQLRFWILVQKMAHCDCKSFRF